MTNSARYSFLGALVGLLVPLAAWALRVALHREAWPMEWEQFGFFYAFMGAQAAASLAAAGYFLGRQSDVLDSERCSCHSTREILNRLALTDGLTGLHNRRSLDEHLTQEFEEAARYGNALSCLMIDVDDFKRLNDAYGHSFGDIVLAGIGQVVAKTVRRADIAGRYGGEEFLVVLPRLAAEPALAAAERLRMQIAGEEFLCDEKRITVTVSIGVASHQSLPPSLRSPRALVAAADRSLYEAKRAGKNRCVLDAAAEKETSHDIRTAAPSVR